MNPLNVLGGVALAASAFLYFADAGADSEAAVLGVADTSPSGDVRIDAFAPGAEPGLLATPFDAAAAVAEFMPAPARVLPDATGVLEAASLSPWSAGSTAYVSQPPFTVALATPDPMSLLLLAAGGAAVILRRARLA